MIIQWLFLSISLLFVVHGAIAELNDASKVLKVSVAEHEHHVPTYANDSTTTEKTLIRVHRLNAPASESHVRQRRQLIETIQTAGFVINVAKAMQKTERGEEILGMAKKVAIAVIVIVSLCIVCCVVTTIVICVKCCCNNDRKRNRAPTTIQVPQPIFVHTGPTGFQSPYQLQQQQQPPPQVWRPEPVASPESRPMLPQPSAPPQPADQYQIEHPPPPYEKLYSGR